MTQVAGDFSQGQTCRCGAGRDAALYTYLQRFEDDRGGAWRTGGVVIQELLQFVLQAAEVGGGAEGLGAPVLDGAEGLWETGKLLEALQQQPVHRLRRLVWRRAQMEKLSTVTIHCQRRLSKLFSASVYLVTCCVRSQRPNTPSLSLQARYKPTKQFLLCRLERCAKSQRLISDCSPVAEIELFRKTRF